MYIVDKIMLDKQCYTDEIEHNINLVTVVTNSYILPIIRIKI